MTLHARPAGAGDIPFTDDDFAVITRRAHRDFGLHLPDSKKELVYSRLLRRLRELRLPDFRAYCALIEAPGSEDERRRMLSALTTNVTHFMREEHHFRLLHDTVLPPLIEKARSGRRVRLWSAGCSAGQEPYSIAFTLLALCPEAPRLDIRILATDVDPDILSRAHQGSYRIEELSSIPDPSRNQHVSVAKGGATFSVGEAARALIGFGELNLIENWPMRGPFDVIFCRNVVIYFDKPTQERLWHRFAGILAPQGHLFIGHSERLSGTGADQFTSVGVTVYRREPAPKATDRKPEGTLECR